MPAVDKSLVKPVTQRSLCKTRVVTPEAERLAVSSKLTVLERRSVSKAIENQYAGYYQKYLNFCLEHGLDPPPSSQTDDHLAEFMDSMFLEGRGVNEGEKVLAAVEFHHCVLKGRMARSRKALRGWRKEVPPQSRIPIPMIIAYGLAMVLLSRKKFNMALKAILDFDTYMRPGESLDLRKRNIVAPVKKAGPQYKWFSIVVRDFDNKKPDKVGVFDNSIPLDSKKRMWIGPILHQLANKCPNKDDQIFDFNMDEFRKEFTAAGSLLGINNLHPYQLRHGGAAADLNSRSRDHQGVKFRGRWNTDVSVRRYTKVGKVQQLMNLLSPKSMAYCHWSVRNLEKVFQGLTPPKHL
jgi:integrase